MDVQNPPTNSVVNLNKSNIFDLLDNKGISWKCYMENYPTAVLLPDCFTDEVLVSHCFAREGFPPTDFHHESNFGAENTSENLYVRKHNSAISYDNIRENPKHCGNIVNASELQKDIILDTVPQFFLLYSKYGK